jgi:3-deoxy-D-manno-octulosonic-acid transferase
MGLFFDFVLLCYIVIVIPFIVFQGKWHCGFAERFGFLPCELRRQLAERKNIWLHAVSVGEVLALEGILERLRLAYPEMRIVLSVTTKSGHGLAVERYSGRALILWSPLDFQLTVGAFVRAINPLVYLAAETELWPNLFNCLAVRGIPVLVLNGRISDKAYPAYNLVRPLLKRMLSQVRCFAMQSDLDLERIVKLGAPKDRVFCTGNVKFDNIPEKVELPSGHASFSGRIWVAGSTHPGEEEIILNIFSRLSVRHSDLRLVLAPRHPERSSAVAALVAKQGFDPVLLSTRDTLPAHAREVLILDRIGCLLSFYAAADLVFVGKSLTVRGGHNIIEPATFARPILVGPYMDNFRDITRLFLEGRAIIQVKDQQELFEALTQLLEQPDKALDLGRRAKAVVFSGRGALDAMFAMIRKVIDERA